MFSCRTIFKQKTPAFSFRITNSEQNFFLCLLNAAWKFILTVGPFGAVHLPDCNLRPVYAHSERNTPLSPLRAIRCDLFAHSSTKECIKFSQHLPL
ncbi:hypothetical protein F383_31745 [Gossypium arboreum]|uniref:Uncharacterized protein n=1 Tax=Gossypium arboreum TaxID=29729 RepID=A0A0B0MZC4_GOSAR|nr:hypothetical protein F383_31745 [Gossypium arboreum]